MAWVAKSQKEILKLIKNKQDKEKMESVMDSAGNVAIWNIDSNKFQWPKLNAKGKVLPLVIQTEPESVKLIQGGFRNDVDKVSGKQGEIELAINGYQLVKFRANNNLQYAPSPFTRGTSDLSSALRTKLQEKGSAYIFDLAINKDRVYKSWKDFKFKYNAEAYKGLKKIWKDDANLDDVEPEWMINFFKQHKVLLPKVGDAKFHDVNRDGGFMEFIEQFVIDEFGHLINSKKDNWNPADVWLVRDEEAIKRQIKDEISTSIYGSGNKESNASAEIQLSQLNYIMRQLFKQKRLMGISLKKVDGPKATYVAVNVSTKFLERVTQISKMGSFTFGKSGDVRPICNMDTKRSTKGTVVWDTDDCRIRTKAGSKTYDFQIKRNVTSSSKIKYDNLKFEPTEAGKGGARMGKAATFLVRQLLLNQGVDFINDNTNAIYPRNSDEFDPAMERTYKTKLQKISSSVELGVDVDEAISNIKAVFRDHPDQANSKLMQITFLHKLFSTTEDKRNKIATDMVFFAAKMGKRFGPHGKIY